MEGNLLLARHESLKSGHCFGRLEPFCEKAHLVVDASGDGLAFGAAQENTELTGGTDVGTATLPVSNCCSACSELPACTGFVCPARRMARR